MKHKHISKETLENFVRDVLLTYEMSEEDAEKVAEVLVYADLTGFDSHGVIHLAEHFAYVPGIENGMINARPTLREEVKTPAMVSVDGDKAMGIVAMNRGLELALQAAETIGIGLAVVKNCFHAGALSYYTRQAALAGKIGIAFCNTGAIVAPPLGKRPAVGSNPISIGAPYLPNRPLILDMAASVVAGGKIEIAKREGKEVPAGWIIDNEGRITRNPADFYEGGALLPLGSTPEMGGYKGYGLGVMIDVLTGVLSGMGHSMTLGTTGGQAHTIIIIDIDKMRALADFSQGMKEMVDDLHQVPSIDNNEILVPGEREWKCYEERLQNGIPLNEKVLQSFQELSINRGLSNYSAQFQL